MTIHPVEVDNKTFYIMKSKRKNKKYDVFDDNYMYILSYGDKNYQHYYDAFKEYNYLNHNDPYRRKNYRKRAEGMGNLSNPRSSNYWSYYSLW